MPRSQLRHARAFIWLAWVGLNTIGVLCAYALAQAVAAGWGLVGLQLTDRGIATIVVLLIGLLLGVAQWLLVRMYLPQPAFWMAATLAGWLGPIALLVVFFHPSIANQRVEIGVLLVSIGLVTGVAQYVFLRRHKSRAGWWIVASTVGWTILALSLPIPITHQSEMIKIGAIPALITGISFALVVASEGGVETEVRRVHAA